MAAASTIAVDTGGHLPALKVTAAHAQERARSATWFKPWFLTFEADVELRIAMTPDDLKKGGLEGAGQKMEMLAGRFGAACQVRVKFTKVSFCFGGFAPVAR